jgi:hypothetical protein
MSKSYSFKRSLWWNECEKPLCQCLVNGIRIGGLGLSVCTGLYLGVGLGLGLSLFLRVGLYLGVGLGETDESNAKKHCEDWA